jgi:protein-L-isoaspartate(D-aspartate) O-methyltransferase
VHEDFKFKGARFRLVEGIKAKGITDAQVLSAIGKVPRQFFMESFLHARAYEDNPLPIGNGQTISQPYTVAFQTQLLMLEKSDKVLEIGTGSGYQTAVLSTIGVRVFSIERIRELYALAQSRLVSMNYRANLFLGDGYKGLSGYGPYDKILITAAAPVIPADLFKQLKVGGLMVLPLGEHGNQIMTVLHKTSDEDYYLTSHGNFSFVPLLPGVE